MPLFDVAILERPTPKDEEEGAQERLVFGPTSVVAPDAQSAAIVAIMGEDIQVDKSRMMVLVRPFAE